MVYALIVLGIIILGIIIAFASNKMLTAYFNKTNLILANCGLTSFELLVYFISNLNLNVKVSEYSTGLNNSYNIKRRLIVLSEDVFSSKSVASLSVSMHELGHAIQHHNKSKLFYLYYGLSILNKITSFLIFPLIIFLIVSLFLADFYLKMALILLLAFYVVNLLIRLIIIPLEKNASNIALNLIIEHNVFDKNELKIAKKLLRLAYTTYIGGFFINYIKAFTKFIKSFN